MKVTYQLTILCQCPIDTNVIDIYDATIVSDFIIRVEEINEAVAEITRSPRFQESLTELLADSLSSDGPVSVTTVGTHSGVRTEVVC